MKAISKKSRKNARKNTNTLTKIRKPVCPPGSWLSSPCSHSPPFTPWNTRLKVLEPTRMKITMAVIRKVVSMPSQTRGQVRRRFIAASTMAPTAPIAPPSVGVARPIRMVPRTRKIRASIGTMPTTTLRASAQPRSVRASSGRAGAALGQISVTTKT